MKAYSLPVERVYAENLKDIDGNKRHYTTSTIYTPSKEKHFCLLKDAGILHTNKQQLSEIENKCEL